MNKYWVKYIPRSIHKPATDFVEIEAKNITGAKRIASDMFKDKGIRSKWKQMSGFEYYKGNSQGTISLYIPYSEVNDE